MGRTRAYRWEDLPREHVRPGVSRAGFRGNDVMLCMNWLQPGMEVRPHSHPEEQLVMVVKGRMRFFIGDETVEVEEGGLVRIPPDVVHCGEVVGDEPVLNLDVFSPLRRDYLHLVTYQTDTFEKA
ncbi:cupin domain [Tepidamorphus gemmatus]|jgi:quercetin dioxygenase-like cupin family protein|uniref:Cupin domain n=1 Tax=Tepidamorphus gemmatus TaxID=747076 RepID=A0A4R3MEL4_9HYPH|nr:cupin domain-containing protein [Tepidamorphus gemmatus]TCT10637.1 cupin domain [Tepidamorphus gemmatus]